jgi:hypothetical protein
MAVATIAALYWKALEAGFAVAPWYDTVFLTGPLFAEHARQVAAGYLPLFDWSTSEALCHSRILWQRCSRRTSSACFTS